MTMYRLATADRGTGPAWVTGRGLGGQYGKGRVETIAAVRFGSIEWPLLAQAAFRALSGLSHNS